jgi:hypothetical protein
MHIRAELKRRNIEQIVEPGYGIRRGRVGDAVSPLCLSKWMKLLSQLCLVRPDVAGNSHTLSMPTNASRAHICHPAVLIGVTKPRMGGAHTEAEKWRGRNLLACEARWPFVIAIANSKASPRRKPT